MASSFYSGLGSSQWAPLVETIQRNSLFYSCHSDTEELNGNELMKSMFTSIMHVHSFGNNSLVIINGYGHTEYYAIAYYCMYMYEIIFIFLHYNKMHTCWPSPPPSINWYFARVIFLMVFFYRFTSKFNFFSIFFNYFRELEATEA